MLLRGTVASDAGIRFGRCELRPRGGRLLLVGWQFPLAVRPRGGQLWLVALDERVEIDLGAQRLVVAERSGKKIAVEVKSFLSASALSDFHTALGQFLNYRLVLTKMEPDRILYLAVPIAAYESFFSRELPQASIQQYQVKLIVYNPVREVIVKWID